MRHFEEFKTQWVGIETSSVAYLYSGIKIRAGHLFPTEDKQYRCFSYPNPIVKADGDPIILPDLHGNALLGIYLLIQFGVINSVQGTSTLESTFEELAQIYRLLCLYQACQDEFTGKDAASAKAEALLARFLKLQASLAINREQAHLVKFIGDVNADRGVSDELVMDLVNKVTDCPSQAILLESNHGIIASIIVESLTQAYGGADCKSAAETMVSKLNRIDADNFHEFAAQLLPIIEDGIDLENILSVSRMFGGVYPKYCNSILQDLYRIFLAEEGDKVSIAQGWLDKKDAMDKKTVFLDYDQETNTIYSHAPAPIEYFLQLALKLGYEITEAPEESSLVDLSVDSVRYAFINSLGAGDESAKSQFKNIVEFINKKYKKPDLDPVFRGPIGGGG